MTAAVPSSGRSHGPTRTGSQGRTRWVRKALLALFSSTLALSLTASIFLLKVEYTVFDARFYVEHLQRAGTFDALSNEMVAEAARARIEAHYAGTRETIVEEVTTVARESLPPEWFEARTLGVLSPLLEYLIGNVDHVEVRLPAADRVKAASEVLARRIPGSEFAEALYDSALDRVSDEIILRMKRLPFGMTISRKMWKTAIEMAASESWVVASALTQIDRLASYLVGETDSLALTIPLNERKEGVAAAIELLVHESNTIEFLKREVIAPAIEERIKGRVIVPSVGIGLSKEECTAAFELVLSSEWLKEREHDIVETMVNYLVGKTDTLDLVVPLGPVKAMVAEALAKAVDTKVEGYYDSLPVCTHNLLAQQLMGTHDELDCRPPGVTYQTSKLLMGINTRAQVWEVLDAKLPDELVHSEAKTRAYVGEPAWARIEQARGWMQNGLVIEEDQLRSYMNQDREDTLERILEVTRAGVEFTEDDVRTLIGEENGETRFEDIRATLLTLQRTRWPLAFAVCLSTLFLAFCARLQLRTLFIGLGAALGLSAILLLVGAMLLEQRLAAPILLLGESARALSGTVVATVARRAPTVARAMLDDFVGAIRAWAVVCAVSSGLVVTAAIFVTTRRSVPVQAVDEPQ